MEIKNNEKLTETLVINKVPSKKIYNQMVKQGLINNDELYIITDSNNDYYKYTFTAINNQSSFTIPFDYEDSETLNVFYNGILMINNLNYRISDKKIQLIDFVTNADDTITVMGIEGPISIDITEQVNTINSGLNQITTRTQQSLETLRSATIAFKDELKQGKDHYLEEITHLGDTYCQDLDERISKIPTDMSQALYKDSKNIMLTGSSLTMYNNYTPTADMDVSTKKYVDTAIENNKLPTTVVQSDITNTFTTGKITMDASYTPTADGDLIDKKYLEMIIKKTIPTSAKEPILFEQNGTFNPADYDLKIGDKLYVVCIGGGGGGSNNSYLSSTGTAAGGSTVGGDYGCGGRGHDSGSAEMLGFNDRYEYVFIPAGGGGGSGYLEKNIITLTSLDPIPITIGNGGGVGSSGGATKFGSYITADGGKPGSAGWASATSTNNSTPGTGGAGGHVGGVTAGGAGWTVKAYTQVDSSGALNKGSGAIFIWY